MINIYKDNSINIAHDYGKDTIVNWTDEANLVFKSNINTYDIQELLKQSLHKGLLDNKKYSLDVNVIVSDDEISNIIDFIVTNEDGYGDIFHNVSPKAIYMLHSLFSEMIEDAPYI